MECVPTGLTETTAAVVVLLVAVLVGLPVELVGLELGLVLGLLLAPLLPSPWVAFPSEGPNEQPVGNQNGSASEPSGIWENTRTVALRVTSTPEMPITPARAKSTSANGAITVIWVHSVPTLHVAPVSSW